MSELLGLRILATQIRQVLVIEVVRATSSLYDISDWADVIPFMRRATSSLGRSDWNKRRWRDESVIVVVGCSWSVSVCSSTSLSLTLEGASVSKSSNERIGGTPASKAAWTFSSKMVAQSLRRISPSLI